MLEVDSVIEINFQFSEQRDYKGFWNTLYDIQIFLHYDFVTNSTSVNYENFKTYSPCTQYIKFSSKGKMNGKFLIAILFSKIVPVNCEKYTES